MTVDFRGLGFQERRQIALVGQRLAVGPRGTLAQGLKRGLRAMLGFADDTCEIAVAHDCDDTGNRAGAVFFQPRELRARVFRPQHAAMQHFRQGPIVDEARPREYLVGNVDPLHGMSS